MREKAKIKRNSAHLEWNEVLGGRFAKHGEASLSIERPSRNATF